MLRLKKIIAKFLKPLSSNRLTANFFTYLYRLSLYGLVGDEWDFHRNGEVRLLHFLNKQFSNSVTLFDVGANEGGYCAILLNVFEGHTDLKIHGFEPASDTFTRYSSRFKEVHNVMCNNIGLSDKEQFMTLYTSSDSSAFSSLYSDSKFDFSSEETIALTTIDDYCSRYSISNIDFLKIDVEGHELAVLNGAIRLMEKNCIKVIQFEFGSGNIGSRTYFQNFYNLLSTDFNLYRVVKNGIVPIQGYQFSLEVFGRVTNYVAILKSLNWKI